MSNEEQQATDSAVKLLIERVGEFGKAPYPLPIIAHWNTVVETGYGADKAYVWWMMGVPYLPSFKLETPNSNGTDYAKSRKYFKKAAYYKVPFTLQSTQFERLLTEDQEYFGLPATTNPNFVNLDGTIKKVLTPFGSPELWREVGRKWTSSPHIKDMQKLYPDPTMVIFLSNNEHTKVRWTELDTCKQWVDLHGTGKDDNYKRKHLSQAWVTCYNAMFEGMREGLTSQYWKDNSRIVGYNVNNDGSIFRWYGWESYSLHYDGVLWPMDDAWEGTSLSCYQYDWDDSTDYTMWNPAVRLMNMVAFLPHGNKIRELSVWDGHTKTETDKRAYYESKGQLYSPERYSGFITLCALMYRPQIIREFRSASDLYDENEGFLDGGVGLVTFTYMSETVKRFWQYGELVENRFQLHPHRSKVPEKDQNVTRWYFLDTSLNKSHPWTLSTEIPVSAIALKIGEKPDEEWLLYAFSPLGDLESVDIVIPEYKAVTVEVPIYGAFYHVTRNSITVAR